MRGTVSRWNDERGFGFIAVEGERKDVFVHRSALKKAHAGTDSRGATRFYINEGDEVEFETAPGKEGKGPQAVNVRVV